MQRRRKLEQINGLSTLGYLLVCCSTAFTVVFQAHASAQQPVPVQPAVSAPGLASQSGGLIHGRVVSGKTPLPGATITATNTLTGKRYATTSDSTGTWSMRIPRDGRYVLRTDLTAFAAVTHEALLKAASRNVAVDFDLQLASREAAQEGESGDASGDQASNLSGAMAHRAAQAMQRLGSGAEGLSLIRSLGVDTDAAAGGATAAGAALPGAAASDAAGEDSVAINGQSGSVNPFAGLDPQQIREAIQQMRAQSGFRGAGAAGGPRGRPGGFAGGPGGFFGGRMPNFSKFRPDQPHGAIFWTGSNSALNALPFTLNGQQEQQPAYGSNRFGATFIGEPFLPGLTKPSGKDTLFFTLSGQRTSTPYTAYATVPDATQRASCSPTQSTVVCNLLAYYPQPNLAAGSNTRNFNYFLASTAQSNSTLLGLRYNRALGSAPAQPFGGLAALLGGRGSQNQGLRQSINFNFNWSHLASDNLNVFPDLGGQQATDSYSLQAGYSFGYHSLNNNLQLGWNRANSQTTNFFTNRTDAASQIGILGPNGTPLNQSPLNYGLPSVIITGFTSLTEQQPTFHLQQTISGSEVLGLIHGKHNIRAGGDYRRVYLDVLGSSNATGTLYFTGFATGNAYGDFLAGLPQESSIKAALAKSYLRQNVWDLFAQDDFRAASSLTLLYGARYEYFSPYVEKDNHLGAIAGNADFSQVGAIYPGCVSAFCAGLPSSLVYPFHAGFAPRVGFAKRLPRSFVVRGGYGINFTNGQYASFATNLAHQPPYANVQTNEATFAASIPLVTPFNTPESAQPPSYSLDAHYHLPYVQAWNIDVQKTLPWAILLNIGYNGSKGTHLDITSAPRPIQQTNAYALPDVLFNYEQSAAFSSFHAGTIRLRRRLEHGVSLGAYYQYSHSIDNAGSIGGTSTVVAQNWQNLLAEEGNSSFDQRHQVNGNYLFELPFGPDKFFLNSGNLVSRALEGWSLSGSFTFSSGTPLTPSYGSAILDVARGTAGTLRPDRVPGQSLTSGAGSQQRWFNVNAYVAPSGPYGNASRNSIPGPGTVSNNMSLSKTAQIGDTRSLELRATANNVFNTVQFSGVDTNLISPTVGQVTSAATMRQFNFLARFRF
uniref:TonB-dependent transporter Oar-like beta-barrel domain-containing protein n=1 Tax=mine drainage metagenome TaxID=410659 RepID=E6QLH7_9ZZZZ